MNRHWTPARPCPNCEAEKPCNCRAAEIAMAASEPILRQKEAARMAKDEKRSAQVTTSEKALAFKSRAEMRVGKILASIKRLYPLGGRNYESSPEQRAAVYDALTNASAELRSAWEHPKAAVQSDFKLP